ncbi:MAG: septum formation family protein [Actinobacteria bacterium]|nr:septum formation family protein [Actinomycetota bacterium]
MALVVALVGVGIAVRWRERRQEDRRSQAVPLEDQDYRPGDCLTWAQDEDGPESDRAEIVPCTEEHLREVVAVLELDDVPGGFPDEDAWRDLKARCHPHVERVIGPYENSILHPLGRPTIAPSRDTWADGDRKLVCMVGLRQVDLAAKRARVRMAFRGRVRDLDLVSPFAAGDCVSWTDEEIGTVPCDQPHQYEVTGVVDLHARPTRPTGELQTIHIASQECPDRLAEHLDGAPAPGISWSWIPMDQDDLDGGVRGLVCLAARFEGPEALELVGPIRP